MGRIGFNIGKDINEKTNIYLKANLMHEFGSGYNAQWLMPAVQKQDWIVILMIPGLNMA